MYGIRTVILLAMVIGAGAAWPAETVEAADAGTGAEALADSEVSRDIDVDLIDLERLREIVEGQEGRERLRLTLEECVYLALDNNQDILVAEFDPVKSDTDVFAARGEFDPILSSNALYMRASQEASPEYKRFGGINSIEVFRTTTSTSVSGKLHYGTMYSVALDMNKEETTYNSFIEEYNGSLTLTLSQPLLRGRSRKVNRALIHMAKMGKEASEHQLRLVVMTTVAEVVKAYWDLVGAVESVKVSEESLANAERLLETSKKRLEIGTAAAIEVLQAKAGVAVRQSDLISARARVADAEDVLKQLLDMRDSGIFSTKQLVPLDRPQVARLDLDELATSDRALEESIALALDKRPEIQLAHVEIENAKIELSRSADGMLPELNLTGTVTQGGRDHYLRQVFYGIRDRRDNGYTVGFQASLPLGNRAARGAYERAQLTLRQAEQRLAKTRQELMLRVRLASRALKTSQILVESNRQTRTLQETNVVAEEKRLRLGTTTSYRVLQIQEDLTLAQTQELQAQIAYEKALVELRLAEGTLLDALGIAFENPESESPVSYLDSVTPDWASPREWVRWVDAVRGPEAPANDAPQE